MSNKVLLKKSSVASKVPLTTDLSYGELALNYADGKQYYLTSGNTVDSFASTTATATLTNKTLTSPTINGGALSGTFSGSITLSGAIALSNSTASTSTSTGALIISGGVGIAGDLNIGGKVVQKWLIKTAAYTAAAGDLIVANTSGGVFTITLPASPTVGQTITIVDGGNWRTNNLIIARNGSTLLGLAEDLTVDIPSIRLDITYTGTTWNVVSSAGAAELPTQAGNSGKYLTTNGSIPSWTTIQGFSTTDDTATDATYYPVIATSAGGSTTKTSSTKLYFNPSTGDLTATNVNSLSDASLKENVVPLGVSVDMIEPVEFTWKDNHRTGYGVIAQDLEKQFPNLVETNSAGIKSVSYMQMIPILIKEIKELKEEIRIMKTRGVA